MFTLEHFKGNKIYLTRERKKAKKKKEKQAKSKSICLNLSFVLKTNKWVWLFFSSDSQDASHLCRGSHPSAPNRLTFRGHPVPQPIKVIQCTAENTKPVCRKWELQSCMERKFSRNCIYEYIWFISYFPWSKAFWTKYNIC